MNCDEKNELDRLKEVRTASEDIFDGVILHVKKDTVRLPNGNSAVREVIRHIGAVCVIPVTEDGNVIMERQYRYPLDRVILEIPAGKLDAPDENRFSAIQRELREETGYTAGTRDLDEDEFLDVCTVPLSDLVRDVMDGRISDAKTQVCVLKAARILGY